MIERRPVAQLAERRSPKPKVGGSMPSWPAIIRLNIFFDLNLDSKNDFNVYWYS